MILYVDVLVTDLALFPNKKLNAIESEVREKSIIYKAQNKFDITKYSLVSYSKYTWSQVIIKYELDDIYSNEEFESFCLSIFENPTIINGRSDNQSKFQESYQLFKENNDEFIFWVANNDHPLMMADYANLDKIVDIAKEITYDLSTTDISISYSHYFESDYVYRKNSPVEFLRKDCEVIYESSIYYLVSFPSGYFFGCQIYHKNLFYKLFFTKSFGNDKIIRPESLSGRIDMLQYVVFPKFEICRHYDGYMHTQLQTPPYILKAKDIPPLFIPNGFFEKQAYIKYGFYEYDESAVNINPLTESYSFENSKKKTDLKISIYQIPYFWKEYLSNIIINEKESMEKMKLAAKKEEYRILNLWSYSYMNKLIYYIYILKKTVKSKIWILLKLALAKHD